MANGVATSLNADGSKTYTLDLNGIAVGSVLALSFDLLGFGLLDSSVKVRDIRLVKTINSAPVAEADTVSVAEDGVIKINVMANDTDAERDALTTILNVGPQHGVVVRNDDGSFTYTPERDFFGSDSFSYHVNDGALDSEVVQVSINVLAVNDAPVAADVNATTLEDAALELDLLAQGRDVDSSSLRLIIVDQPTHGQLSVAADGKVTYLPNANYSGSDSFSYRLSDGLIDSNTASVSLTVGAVNDAPQVADISVNGEEDRTVLVNVLASASDVDSNSLRAIVVDAPLRGSLQANPDGTSPTHHRLISMVSTALAIV